MNSLKFILLILLLQLSACAKNTTGVDTMNTALTEGYSIKNNPHNKTISYLKSISTTVSTISKTPLDNGFDFLQRYRKDFLLENPRQELSIASNKQDNLGFTRIKLHQNYQGIPVWKGVISLHFDRQNALQLVNGQYFPTPSDIDINAGMTVTEIFQRAFQFSPSISQQEYSAQKIIFFKNEITPRLAYELKPTRHANLASNTFVLDAITGDILNQLSTIKTLR